MDVSRLCVIPGTWWQHLPQCAWFACPLCISVQQCALSYYWSEVCHLNWWLLAGVAHDFDRFSIHHRRLKVKLGHRSATLRLLELARRLIESADEDVNVECLPLCAVSYCRPWHSDTIPQKCLSACEIWLVCCKVISNICTVTLQIYTLYIFELYIVFQSFLWWLRVLHVVLWTSNMFNAVLDFPLFFLEASIQPGKGTNHGDWPGSSRSCMWPTLDGADMFIKSLSHLH